MRLIKVQAEDEAFCGDGRTSSETLCVQRMYYISNIELFSYSPSLLARSGIIAGCFLRKTRN